MPGSKRGEHRGGREKGTPNKFSAQRVEVLGRQGRKRPDEELVDLFYYCRGQAARVQPEIIDENTGKRVPNPAADIVEHGKWIDRSREAARDAAPYYAAKLAAVAFSGNVAITEESRADPRQIMWETYLGMRRRGELAQKVVEAPKIERGRILRLNRRRAVCLGPVRRRPGAMGRPQRSIQHQVAPLPQYRLPDGRLVHPRGHLAGGLPRCRCASCGTRAPSKS